MENGKNKPFYTKSIRETLWLLHKHGEEKIQKLQGSFEVFKRM